MVYYVYVIGNNVYAANGGGISVSINKGLNYTTNFNAAGAVLGVMAQ